MKVRVAWWLFGLWCAAVGAVNFEIHQFDDPQKQQHYDQLIQELRCLVCQNQSLAESDADLAKDLRREVYQLIESGKTDREAAQFLVARYGDFVLYRPPLQANTVLLWGGPGLVLLVGLIIARRQVVGRRRRHQSSVLTPEEQTRLREVLDNRGMRE